MMLEVLRGGLHTTVQDMGRQGGQSLGIPPSGAQDGFALRIANLLVGNPTGGPLILRDDPGAVRQTPVVMVQQSSTKKRINSCEQRMDSMEQVARRAETRCDQRRCL